MNSTEQTAHQATKLTIAPHTRKQHSQLKYSTELIKQYLKFEKLNLPDLINACYIYKPQVKPVNSDFVPLHTSNK